jgi:pyruvate dehydrogenase E2 component (dihydrolipoamide acetyltransferase)
MPIDILMPALSPTMKKGKLSKWRKLKGEVVNPGDVLAEVETDKAIMEVEAADSGILAEILIAEGTEDVPVNATIAVLLEEGEEESTQMPSAAPEEKVSVQEKEVSTVEFQGSSVVKGQNPLGEIQKPLSLTKDAPSRIFASPLAKRLAKESSIDLAQVQGSGPRGRIVKRDLADIKASTPSTLSPLSPLRKAIASRLSASKNEIPHFYLTRECDVTNLMSLRQELISSAEVKLSLNDFVVKAAALSLKRVPEVNSAWSADGIIQHESVDISVAVSIDGGLMTPIVFEANKKGIVSIADEIRKLALSARERKLTPQQYQGGTFTVSNLGMYGISEFAAIINPPQAAILAVGAVEEKVCKVRDEFVLKSIIKVTLSCDHRVIDGAMGAKWLSEFSSLMSSPLKLVL